MKAQIGLDRLTGLIAFARAASLGSYTAAARELSVSPSAVSKSVQRLEEHFGLMLFTRTTRSLTLTPEGRDLYERALRILREVEEIDQAAVASRAEPSGVLKVTAALPIGVNILAPALPRFREQYPKLAIDLRLGDQYSDIIEQGIDVAIRVGNLTDSRLVSRPLGPHRIGAFASPQYLQRKGTPMTAEDLAGHECVNFRYQSTGQSLRWPYQAGDKQLEWSPDVAFTVDVSDAVAAIMAAGGGVGITPYYVAAPYVRRGELIPVLPQFTAERFSITALWPESRRGSPNVKAFIAFLLELFPATPAWDEAVNEAAAANQG
ncbi:LysR family transcriptional regulator [Pseudomonas corrugata]|uniref:LysR family transcriptional regulator n=1 Tax=Pseudomonas corrugata TaxID=47879 RepID=A0A8B6UXA5_9PSED|nr:LysR family transcriptional regulator [Pseudomonas corrugata]MDU9040519.1 LysR family transcriptional regulator [Pseudomonas corrugata]QTH16532.1 LysR family transcriptional regulator [Pseudomonas corrugata]UZE08399.1 LysR family transcriptional regulator [Pseudomonas corrugata]